MACGTAGSGSNIERGWRKMVNPLACHVRNSGVSTRHPRSVKVVTVQVTNRMLCLYALFVLNHFLIGWLLMELKKEPIEENIVLIVLRLVLIVKGRKEIECQNLKRLGPQDKIKEGGF